MIRKSTPPDLKKDSGGRPPKFTVPSKRVTLTLPEDILEDLLLIDGDKSHAIVKLTRNALQKNGVRLPLVELIEVAPHKGLIVVASSNTLHKIPFLHLVEYLPGRFLLALDSGHDFKTLELSVADLLDATPTSEKRETQLLTELLEVVKRMRKTERVTMAEILFIHMDDK